jgi:N-acetylated-alpha-linked acidic dipeptidase
VQRGSVEDMPVAPGDPLTPDVGATKDARRLPLAEATTVLKIPVLPISYRDAQPLLEALGGPVAPPAWRGSLPITYHLGPGPARVHLSIASDWGQKPIYDVIARLKGSERPDQWVIRGNHHDGWVFGAWDPLSANVALMAEAKAIGELTKSGWRPKCTLVYASWDGEEPGLLGSTEWVETHAEELRRKAVVYVNSDSNGRGFLDAGGSHSLQKLVDQVAAEIRDPETGTNALERSRAKLLVNASGKNAGPAVQEIAKRLQAGEVPPLGALGSGSDYTPFLQHLGIASLDIGYGGRTRTPVSITRFTTRSTTTCGLATLGSYMESSWPGPSAASCCGWPTLRCCHSGSDLLPELWSNTPTRSTSSPRTCGSRPSGSTNSWTSTPSNWPRILPSRMRRQPARRVCRS